MSEQFNDFVRMVQKTFNDAHVLKFSLVPLLLILSAAAGLNFWLKVEVLLSLIFGVALMVPQTARYFLDAQLKGQIDNYQLFLCGLIGCYVIYAALFPFFLKGSRDESIFVSHFWSRIISSNLMFLAMFFSYLDGLRWDYHLLCYSGGAVLTALVVNVFFLANSSTIRAQNHNRLPANLVAKVEFFMLLSAGLIFFAFPNQAMLDLKDANDGHRLLARCAGALLFSLSIESFTMPSFLFEKDKQSFLAARLIGSLLELVVILLGYYYFGVIKTIQSLGIYLFVNMSYNSLILYGYVSCVRKVNELRTRADQLNTSGTLNSSLNASINEKNDKKSS